MIETAPSTAWYVYAVVGSPGDELREALGETRGVGADELSLVEADGLTAVVGSVPLTEFGEAALHERLNDRSWLEEKARAHEEVLQRVAKATAAIVPLRFGSIHRALRDVEALLEERREPFERALAHVRGRVEIGVKGWLEPRREDSASTAPSGRAYLERRREERSREESETAELEDALHEVHARLLGLAVDGVLNRPQPRELTGRPERMVLNAAYLVPADDEALVAAVAELAARYRSRGLVLEVTGPWPPHNFVDPGEQP